MAFYLSPLVDVKEIDLSTTIPAVATSIGVVTLRNTVKGPEMTKVLVSSEDEMIYMFGQPTDAIHNYRDMLGAAGFLKFGNKLYCTRVLPNDATFAGTKLEGDGTFTAYGSAGALTLEDLDLPGGGGGDAETADPNRFHESVQPSGSDIMWTIAASRGAWGNHVRVAFINKTEQVIINSNQATSDATSGWYPWNYDIDGNLQLRGNWAIAPSASGYLNPVEYTYSAIASSDLVIQADTEFVVVIQERDDANDDWDTAEIWHVGTTEGQINDDGYPMFCETRINEMSRSMKVSLAVAQEGTDWTTSTPEWVYLTDGSGGTVDATNGVDLGTLRYALDLYENPEEIDVNILLDCDKPLNTKRYMIEFCEARKDCMCILDVPMNLVVENRGEETTDLVEWRKGVGSFSAGNNLNENTSYAALYANWLEVYDKYNNKYRWIPAAGHVGGIYANTDDVTDPWWAPAGLNRAILTSIRRLAWNPALGHRDILYKNGLNPIVSFAGQGKVVWGQKTMLDKPSSFNRVNVRRLFIVLEKAIATASKYFLFEPNDAITRRQLVTMIEPFLRDVQARRGIYDFQVICDETNNTPERIDRNELWCTILVKATRVSEFIVLQFVSLKTGASFEEAAAQVNPQVSE